MKKILIYLVVIFSSLTINAQNSEFGIGFGAGVYSGDLSNNKINGYFNDSHPAIQAFYNYYFNSHLLSKISFGTTTLSGSDSKSSLQWQNERNLSFKTNIYELSAVLEYNILNYNSRINPYVFAGLNGFHYNPKTLYKGEWVYLQPLGTEGQGSPNYPEKRKYNLYGYSMVFGSGIKFKLNNAISFSLEFGLRRTNTDYIDDVSGTYVNYLELYRTNGELAANLSDRTGEYFGSNQNPQRIDGTQRGGEKVRDYYSMTFLNCFYKLNSGNPFKNNRRVNCPKF